MPRKNVISGSDVAAHQNSDHSSHSKVTQIWQEVSKAVGGSLKTAHATSNALIQHTLKIPYKNYEILLSQSGTKSIEFEIEFQSEIDYKLDIFNEDYLEKVLKIIWKKEIEIRYEKFDKQYIIRSNDPEKTIALLTINICDKILSNNILSISFSANRSKKIGKLLTSESGKISSAKEILDQIELHQLLIDRLTALNIVK